MNLKKIKINYILDCYGWINEHGQDLKERLYEGSGFFGEWIGMGKLKYPELNKKLYMFAKANFENNEVKNIYYDIELFKFPFVNQEFPDYLDIVPIVDIRNEYPEINTLNKLYKEYSLDVNRNVEGFIVIHNNSIKKYVRMKNGKLQDHHE